MLHTPFYFTGKFQMQVMSGCGHSVHEDVPDKVKDPNLPLIRQSKQ